MYAQLREALRDNVTRTFLLVILALGVAIVLGLLLKGLVVALITANVSTLSKEISLPLLAIGGVAVLILLLTLVATLFALLGLTDKRQAMGLPEGSIRAAIALSLIVLFAILSVFLNQNLLYGTSKVVNQLTDSERLHFLSDHPSLQGVESVPSKDNGNVIKNAAGEQLYDVIYRDQNSAADDFAKQLLVLLGTLMTAITSFYLGAGTAVSAAAAAQTLGSPHPTITGISPTSHDITNDGPVVHLQVMGSDLNSITSVKIMRGAVQIAGTNVKRSPTVVACDIPVSVATTPPGPLWDVVVDDGGSNSTSLPRVLTIT